MTKEIVTLHHVTTPDTCPECGEHVNALGVIIKRCGGCGDTQVLLGAKSSTGNSAVAAFDDPKEAMAVLGFIGIVILGVGLLLAAAR